MIWQDNYYVTPHICFGVNVGLFFFLEKYLTCDIINRILDFKVLSAYSYCQSGEVFRLLEDI